MISGGYIIARGTRHNGHGLCSTMLLPQVVGNKHGYLGPFPETFKSNFDKVVVSGIPRTFVIPAVQSISNWSQENCNHTQMV